MRNCLWCNMEVPIGNVGLFCDSVHKWMFNRKVELEGKDNVQNHPTYGYASVVFLKRNGTYHGYSPRKAKSPSGHRV